MTLSLQQRSMLREIGFMAGHRDARALARRAGTTPSGAIRTLRSLGSRDLVTESVTGQWSVTQQGREALDAADAKAAGA